MKFATRLLTFDPAPGDRFTPANTPIYQTATFRQDDATSFGEYDYSRSGNPTRCVVEKQIAALEGGTRGFCFSTGLAAITAVTRLLCPGDEILACDDLYGGTYRLFSRILTKRGIEDISPVAASPSGASLAVGVSSGTARFDRHGAQIAVAAGPAERLLARVFRAAQRTIFHIDEFTHLPVSPPGRARPSRAIRGDIPAARDTEMRNASR